MVHFKTLAQLNNHSEAGMMETILDPPSLAGEPDNTPYKEVP